MKNQKNAISSWWVKFVDSGMWRRRDMGEESGESKGDTEGKDTG